MPCLFGYDPRFDAIIGVRPADQILYKQLLALRMGEHVGMQRIMEQLGFEADATTRPYTAPNGESYEAYWYRCGSDTHAPLGMFEV